MDNSGKHFVILL